MNFASLLGLGQTALELGLICSLTVLALFLSYSMLNVCASLISSPAMPARVHAGTCTRRK